ncbi:hypothetical protein A9Q86_15515 [Flavobacteriales bacterium 33_180_T64]|nr:hypothetical protein A9Q86_15515 [Flavobacteriales bacterium 33_180_T64]
MKIFKIIALVALVVFVGIQFIPTTLNQSDIVYETDFMIVNNVSETIQSKFKISCYDCHSNNTAYPWYHKIQPIAWFMGRHIEDGKAELNFNEWGNYSDRRKKSKIKSIISQIKDGKMPLSSYTLIHGRAKLSESDEELIIKWIDDLKIVYKR